MKNIANCQPFPYIIGMTRLQALKKHLRPGRVYRREDLARWSNAVDRHLKQLQDDGTLTKLAGGLYLYPKDTVFGKAPAEDDRLVGTFLKDHRFVVTGRVGQTDDAHLAAAKAGEAVLIQAIEIHAVDHNRPAARSVYTGNQIE